MRDVLTDWSALRSIFSPPCSSSCVRPAHPARAAVVAAQAQSFFALFLLFLLLLSPRVREPLVI